MLKDATLERSLSSSYDPGDWAILADWYEEHGDTARADEWRERARIGEIAARVLAPMSLWWNRNLGITRHFWNRVELWVFSATRRVTATISVAPAELPLAKGAVMRKVRECRIDPTLLRECIPPDGELSSVRLDPADHARKHVARAMHRIVDAILDARPEDAE